MVVKKLMQELEDLEDEYNMYKIDMMNAIEECKRAMDLMNERESKILLLRKQAEQEISNN